MKQIKTFLAALAILTAASSCNKDTDTIVADPPVPANAKLTKVEFVGANDVETYTYNTDGRLINYNDNIFQTKYTYPAGTLNIRMFKANGSPFVDISNVTLANDKITSYEFRMFHGAGEPDLDGELNSFEYDANGYQIRRSYGSYVYDFTITGGNIVNMKETNNNNGQVYNTVVEYYTDKPNNLNINLFENWYFDQYTVDLDLFGKKSKNLPKKVTGYYGVKELSYTMNPGGLPAEILVKSTSVAGVVTTQAMRLSYQ